MAKIILPHGHIKTIANELGYSERTVRNALNGITSSSVAKLIRAKALQDGGYEFNGKKGSSGKITEKSTE